MRKLTACIIMFLTLAKSVGGQDTFSMVAVDTATKEVGSAGASCVDLFVFSKEPDFIGELVPGKGAINTQASYDEFNQGNAYQRMAEDSTPQAIINWLANNDVANNPSVRQYGIASFVKGAPQTAGYTGANCFDWKGHKAGYNYCIQGNILLGPQVLDSMEARFLREKGDLKTKLMAAMQGAKMVGADTRCAPNNSSTLFAYVKVAKATDIDGANPSFKITVKTKMNDKIEPIDSLQKLFNKKIAQSNLQVLDKDRMQCLNNGHSITIQHQWNAEAIIKIYAMTGRAIGEWGIKPYEEKNIETHTWPEGIFVCTVHNQAGQLMSTFKLKR